MSRKAPPNPHRPGRMRACPVCRGRRGGAARWIAAMLALLASAAPSPGELRPDSHKPSMYEVEAVYLYDFGKFVRWPAGTAKDPLTICVTGNPDYEKALERTVAGENIGGRALTVKHVDRPQDEANCDILFVGSSEQDRLDAFLAAVAGRPTLTVSDAPGFLDHGGMIQFVVLDDRVRFAVNLKPAADCKLSLSSELLKVAVSVTGAPSRGGGQ